MTIWILESAELIIGNEHTWTAKKKKFRLKSLPETQNLLIIVMEIEAAQYAKIEIIGLFVIDDAPWILLSVRLPSIGDERPVGGGMLAEYSYLFLSSIVVFELFI